MIVNIKQRNLLRISEKLNSRIHIRSLNKTNETDSIKFYVTGSKYKKDKNSRLIYNILTKY